MQTEEKKEEKQASCSLLCPVCGSPMHPQAVKCDLCNSPRCVSCGAE